MLLCINFMANSAFPAFLKAFTRTVLTLSGISLPLSTILSPNLQASFTRPALHNTLIVMAFENASGSSLLSPSFERLFEALASPDLRQVASKKNIRAHLRKWEKNLLPEIHAVLEDAEMKQTESSLVQIWMSKVGDLVYDVEDVLDEFATEILRHKLKKKHQAAAAAAAAAGGGGAEMSEVMKFKLSWITAGYSRYRFNAEMSFTLKPITARLVTSEHSL